MAPSQPLKQQPLASLFALCSPKGVSASPSNGLDLELCCSTCGRKARMTGDQSPIGFEIRNRAMICLRRQKEVDVVILF